MFGINFQNLLPQVIMLMNSSILIMINDDSSHFPKHFWSLKIKLNQSAKSKLFCFKTNSWSNSSTNSNSIPIQIKIQIDFSWKRLKPWRFEFSIKIFAVLSIRISYECSGIITAHLLFESYKILFANQSETQCFTVYLSEYWVSLWLANRMPSCCYS